MTDAKLKPPSAQVVEDCELDIIVTRLYRRFKDWSRRGFGPDDVTWCEVRADVTAAILPLFAAREAAVRAEALKEAAAKARNFSFRAQYTPDAIADDILAMIHAAVPLPPSGSAR
jgi:hypothetical protein